MSTHHYTLQHNTTRVNTPHLDILAGPGDHLGEELGVVGVVPWRVVVGALGAPEPGERGGLGDLLQHPDTVAQVVSLLEGNRFCKN